MSVLQRLVSWWRTAIGQPPTGAGRPSPGTDDGDQRRRRGRLAALAVVFLLLLAGGYYLSAGPAVDPASPAAPGSSSGPSSGSSAAGARVCGSDALKGPASPPAGAVPVAVGKDLGDIVEAHPEGTTFWLAPGKHTLGKDEFDQVIPKKNNVFIGAPGAILDGQRVNRYAFTGQATGVTISNLTVRNFGPVGSNNNEGVVNHDSAKAWTLKGNTISDNAGAGVMVGSDNKLIGNCLANNGQYGFNAYHAKGVRSVVLDGNEIANNNTDDWEKRQPGCGCTGGGKFWETSGATVTKNYVHNNKGAGLWADTNNTGFLFQGNLIADNDDEGLFYETSYNAAILDNTFIRNGIVKGPTNPGFPTGAIYLSESGSDRRVKSAYNTELRIAGNTFIDNWSGVIAWENADRFAGSPANTSTGYTTLVNPSVATLAACGNAATIDEGVLLKDCRWRTQNVVVEGNSFSLDRSKLPGCAADTACGYNGIFSNYGTYPDWSPYKGDIVPEQITFDQGNVFRHNTYQGPWGFIAKTSGHRLSFDGWRAAPYKQDQGSTLSS